MVMVFVDGAGQARRVHSLLTEALPAMRPLLLTEATPAQERDHVLAVFGHGEQSEAHSTRQGGSVSELLVATDTADLTAHPIKTHPLRSSSIFTFHSKISRILGCLALVIAGIAQCCICAPTALPWQPLPQCTYWRPWHAVGARLGI